MFKKISVFIIIASIMVTTSACSSSKATVDSSKIQVTVSFNAMREFTEAIGKDKVQVTTIIPNGTEPHEFNAKAKDLVALSNSKIFVYNGFGMETWVDSAIQSIASKNLVVVDASKGAEPIKNTDPELAKNDGQYDPHLWISLKGAENEANNIRTALEKVDPTNKDYYEKNYNDFYNKLESIYTDYKNKFDSISNKNFVTGHAAFGYLCRDFGLTQNSVEDVFAEGEPSALRLKELVDYCKQNKIKTIFVEDMVSPKVSEALATEVGAKAEKIYTIESREDNLDYLQSMKYNLEMIYNSLK